ncbi:MAG TPA: electron transport complex subunit RsxA [Clostridiales bacterium]|jgi:electron transport complex protein RnfA|nr:electron transport complex subunit RsxA [Clostridiales bacterium]
MRLNDVGIFLFFVNCALVNNFIFSRFLGNCPYLGVSNKLSTATGMGIAVTFVMGLSSLFAYIVNTYLLVPLDLQYLQTISFILIIAALVQFVEMFMKKSLPALYSALGIYLPLITTNCAVLGVTLVNVKAGYNMIESVLSGVFGALGFLLAIVLMAGIRERIEHSDIPEAFKGFPICLIIAGMMSLAFFGFQGLVK